MSAVFTHSAIEKWKTHYIMDCLTETTHVLSLSLSLSVFCSQDTRLQTPGKEKGQHPRCQNGTWKSLHWEGGHVAVGYLCADLKMLTSLCTRQCL